MAQTLPAISLYITCCYDYTTKTLRMPKPAKPSLSKMRWRSSSSSFASSSLDLYRGHILWLDTADLSDRGPIIGLQVLQVRLGQLPSFTGMEHGAQHTRAVYMATGLVREVAGCENSFRLFSHE